MVTGLEEFVMDVSNARQKSLANMYPTTTESIKNGYVVPVMTKEISDNKHLSVELILQQVK